MSEAIDVIKREIARRQAEIAALTLAVDALQGTTVPDTKPLQLPAPKQNSEPEDQAAGAGRRVYTINGHDISLGAKLFAVLDAINEAEDCQPIEKLQPIFDGNRLYVQQAVSALNKKLRPAGAEILYFKGEGYRLQNLGGSE